jgi:hypothetical protein
MKNRKSKIVRILAVCVIAVPLMVSIGCSPIVSSIASVISFGAGWLGASQITDVVVENRCFVNGAEVDCADVGIPD